MNKKDKKIILVLVVAIIFAALAGFGVWSIMTPTRTTVYVFNGDYNAGTQVTANMLTAVEVDSKVVVANQNFATSDFLITSANYDSILASAGVLRNSVYAGSVLTSSMLSSTGGNAIEMAMKKDAVAVTVGVTNITGITGELRFGSRVNVYAAYDDGVHLVLQNVRVIATTRGDTGILSATLEVSAADSLVLIHASEFGTIHLGLVDYNNYQALEDGVIYNGSQFTKK